MEENEDGVILPLVMSAAIVPVFFVLASLCIGLSVLVYYVLSLPQ